MVVGCCHDHGRGDCSNVFLPIYRVWQVEDNRMCDFWAGSGREFFYVSRFVQDSFRKASAEYKRDDPSKALAYAAMGLLCLLVWIGALTGVYSVMRGFKW